MQTKFTKLAAGIVLSLGVSASSWALPTWNVNDTVVPGVGALGDDTVLVDVLNGRYGANISQTVISTVVNGGADGNIATPADNITIVTSTFTETGVGDLSSYFLNNISVTDTYLNGAGPGAGPGYKIYAAFSVSGVATFKTSGGVTSVDGVFTTGNAEIYLDANKDSLGGSGDVPTLTIGLDDKLIGTATVVDPSLSGFIIGNLSAKGSYRAVFTDFDLTPFGDTYWNEPVPFHLIAEVSGENEKFNPALTPGNYHGTSIGDFSLNFVPVPEPCSSAWDESVCRRRCSKVGV